MDSRIYKIATLFIKVIQNLECCLLGAFPKHLLPRRAKVHGSET